MLRKNFPVRKEERKVEAGRRKGLSDAIFAAATPEEQKSIIAHNKASKIRRGIYKAAA